MDKIFPSDHLTIWRYLDFRKFIALIDSSSLFFCRLDLLEDKFEGISPLSQVKDLYKEDPKDEKLMNGLIKSRKEIEEMWKKYTGVNCWHINHTESAAMWQIYSQFDYGVAVKSNGERLRKCFIPRESHEVLISRVKYGDFDEMVFGNVLYSNYFHKRDFYSYENELRAIVVCDISEENNKKALIEGKELRNEGGVIIGGNINLDKLTGIKNGGIHLKVDLNELIDKVIIAPNTPTWIANLIENITKKYNYNFKIETSKM